MAEITSIEVDPDKWGQGFGKALSETALQKLRKCGFQEIMLWVLSTHLHHDDNVC